ncbi:amino acid ABC transporter substrate-binding protein [Actinomadura sp. KC345]|uniref:ABC transporter substrate-binding protein n=1 Tax=Actinomadura sp. KC345 TaxID=2530371 RepID=UPI00104F7DC1|nr:ABC transporter substrate-binding protein [Actinomadura sp. KC345]TDC46049.1 amino acid ABC transporter substrate-binding protein [Actinomadura sp. KC345]
MQGGRRFRTLALTAVTALALAACGGDGGDGEDTNAGAGSKDGVLKLGYVFPESGELAHLGPPQVSAAKYAISEINKAGGVLGKPMPEVVGSDEGGKAEIANASVDRLLGQNVDGIVGAAASGMSLAILDKVKSAQKVQCSGSNTAPTFTGYKDDGFYFRTAPSDVLQGPILADTITGDGHATVAVAYRGDDYGKGLAEATKSSLEKVGATVPVMEAYEPNTTNFNATVTKIRDAKPDAVVMVSFQEGAQLGTKLLEAGFKANQFYSADGMKDEEMAQRFSKNDPAVIEGFKGTGPASVDNKEFTDGLKAFDPKLEVFQYAPQVYDCVLTMALAAETAKTDDPAAFKAKMNEVTKGGEKCTTFTQCRDLIKQGKDIDYDGASGPLDFTEPGEPGATEIEIYEYNDKGKFEIIDTVQSKPLA